jgi:type II secretion system protein C
MKSNHIKWLLSGVALVAGAVVLGLKLTERSATAVVRPDSAATDDPRPREPLAPGLLDATAVSVQAAHHQLYLVETIPGRSPREGAALIGTDPRVPQRYSAGASLLNGARLVEIHNRYVVLERENESLRLYLAGASQESKIASSDLAFVGGPQPVLSPPELATDRLSEIMRLAPVYENDLLVGFRLHTGTRPGLFDQLGLSRNDLLVAIDGAPVSDPATISTILEPLTAGAAMAFTVRRQDMLTTVVLDGEIVTRAFDATALAAQNLPGHLNQ